jgi:hypothetical protein
MVLIICDYNPDPTLGEITIAGRGYFIAYFVEKPSL